MFVAAVIGSAEACALVGAFILSRLGAHVVLVVAYLFLSHLIGLVLVTEAIQFEKRGQGLSNTYLALAHTFLADWWVTRGFHRFLTNAFRKAIRSYLKEEGATVYDIKRITIPFGVKRAQGGSDEEAMMGDPARNWMEGCKNVDGELVHTSFAGQEAQLIQYSVRHSVINLSFLAWYPPHARNARFPPHPLNDYWDPPLESPVESCTWLKDPRGDEVEADPLATQILKQLAGPHQVLTQQLMNPILAVFPSVFGPDARAGERRPLSPTLSERARKRLLNEIEEFTKRNGSAPNLVVTRENQVKQLFRVV